MVRNKTTSTFAAIKLFCNSQCATFFRMFHGNSCSWRDTVDEYHLNVNLWPRSQLRCPSNSCDASQGYGASLNNPTGSLPPEAIRPRLTKRRARELIEQHKARSRRSPKPQTPKERRGRRSPIPETPQPRRKPPAESWTLEDAPDDIPEELRDRFYCFDAFSVRMSLTKSIELVQPAHRNQFTDIVVPFGCITVVSFMFHLEIQCNWMHYCVYVLPIMYVSILCLEVFISLISRMKKSDLNTLIPGYTLIMVTMFFQKCKQSNDYIPGIVNQKISSNCETNIFFAKTRLPTGLKPIFNLFQNVF